MTKTPAVAQLVASVLLDENTMLLLGQAAQPLDGQGQVSFGDDARAGSFVADARVGSFAAESWPEGDGHWFLACLKVEQILALRPTALVGADGQSCPLPEAAKRTLEPGPLVASLAGVAGRHMPAIVAFLRGQDATRRVLAELLATTASLDGYVEVFGRVRDGELYLQGWSQSIGSGEVELLFETECFVANPALIAPYGRPDLAAPAEGMVAVVQPVEPVEPRDVRRVYYWRGDGYGRLDVYENRLLFGDAETAAYAAGILPQLQAEPAVHAALKRLAAPRYQGHETVSTLQAPVRAAVDTACWVAGEGVFLTGWLLDPEQRVTAVSCGAAGGWRSRIDQRWTRSRRPDVSQGFTQDELFAGRFRPFDDDHGFLAFVACSQSEPGEMYLEVELADGQVGFLPVRASRPVAADRQRILVNCDLNHPDIGRMIDQHVGPIITAIGRQLGGAPQPRSAYEFGVAGTAAPRISVVVPVPAGRADIDVTMARLAVEPTIAGVEVIFAAPAAAVVVLGPQLPRQARFYGLSGRLVVSDDADAFDAMTVGAAAARADLLLFLGAAVLPRQGGWLGQLEKLLQAAPRAAAISPTLLYEDLSVRFAGSKASGWEPPKDVTALTSCAGYARHWLAREAMRPDAAVPVYAIAHECCLIRRRAFEAVGGFSGDLVGSGFKAFDLSLKLRSARQQCLWASGIEMLAPDEAVGEPEYWVRTGALVDRWGFARKWSDVFAKAEGLG
jgi:O-antigen biosynthesis protein